MAKDKNTCKIIDLESGVEIEIEIEVEISFLYGFSCSLLTMDESGFLLLIYLMSMMLPDI